MKNTVLSATFVLALLSTWMAIPACKTPESPPPITPVAPGAFSACTSDAIKATARSLLGKVATAVATGDYKTQLEQLVSAFGQAEVDCAVQLFVDSMTRKAEADPLAATQLANAQAWLKR